MQHTGYILDYLRLSLHSNKRAITYLFSHLLLLAIVSCVGTGLASKAYGKKKS